MAADDLNTIGRRDPSKRKKGKPSTAMRVFSLVGGVLFGFLHKNSAFLISLLPIVIILIAFKFFTLFYYERNDVFKVAPNDIIVRGNSTITQSYILQCFNINEPKNGFELLRSDIVPRLSQTMPILKDAKMTYTVGGKLEIWVEERMPVARIAGNIRPPLVVDEEGMIFFYSRPTTTYPEIAGFDLPDEALRPGQKLPESLLCMLRLLLVVADTENFFPSAVKRVSLLGMDPEDGLKVTLVDGRKIDIAWENMASETESSEAMMTRLRNVARVLKSSAAEGMTHFNAMAIDRVTISE